MASEMLNQVLQAEEAAAQLLQETRDQAKEILRQAHSDAAALREEGVAQAQCEADAMLALTQKQTEQDLQQGAVAAQAAGDALQAQGRKQQAAAVAAVIAHVVG